MITPSRHPIGHARQSGISLIFALITLVSLMLASLALVRSVNSGSQVLGNIGFQQDATATADIATSEAALWISSGVTLTTSSGASSSGAAADRSGFYANVANNLDVTGQQLTSVTRQLVDWDLDGCAYAAAGTYGGCTIIPHDANVSGASTGNTARYVIFRLCQADGEASSGTCNKAVSTGSGAGGAARGACEVNNDGCTRLGSEAGDQYRIVVRVVGARGTTSFTETVVQY